ncbi:MAG: hypothetical protein Q8N53_18140 [Longimicrobiales bacterium]|nr:hypothetical protein [Longimicrobiales bacterium]
MLVRSEAGHPEVAAAFADILDRHRPLVTTNYVVLETVALLQRRIGLPAVQDLDQRILPLCTLRWVTESIHRRAMDHLIRADRRSVSLVDHISFEVMRAEGITDALALDSDFADAGFRLLPGNP